MIGLGSSAQLGIGIAVRLHDQFSGQAARINQQLMAMKKNSYSALTGAMQQYRNNALMIAGAATGVGIGMFRMVDAAATFDHLINQIYIVGGKNLGKTRAELSQFAQDMSAIFPNKPSQVAAAMFENVKAGVTTGLDLITKYQIAVSTATNEAIEGEQGVAAGLLGIMNAMDLTTAQFPRVANTVSQAANISMASVNSINESMQYFANTAHAANLDLETTLALVAKLSQANIRGSIAGTALSNMIRHLTYSMGPMMTPKKAAAWNMLGLDPKQMEALMDQSRIFDIIDLVDKATRGMGYTKKENILHQIFGVRGEKALINLFGSADPTKTFRALRESIYQGGQSDIAMKQAAAMSQDPWAEIRKIGNAIARFGIQFLQAARPTLMMIFKIVRGIVNFSNAILSSPIGKVLAGIAVVAVPLIGVLFAFRAAALTATLALRGFSAMSTVGGFGGLFRGGLGMLGASRFGQYGGKFSRNAAGRLMVTPGQTLTFGGKNYSGGQLLPQAFASSLGIGSVFSKTGSSFFSRALPWLGKSLGFLGRLTGIGTGIWLGVELLKGIFGLTKAKEERQILDPVFLSYYKHLDEQLFGLSQANSFYNREGMSYGEFMKMKEGRPLQQTININLDGKQANQLLLTQSLEDQLNNTMDFELPGF